MKSNRKDPRDFAAYAADKLSEAYPDRPAALARVPVTFGSDRVWITAVVGGEAAYGEGSDDFEALDNLISTFPPERTERTYHGLADSPSPFGYRDEDDQTKERRRYRGEYREVEDAREYDGRRIRAEREKSERAYDAEEAPPVDYAKYVFETAVALTRAAVARSAAETDKSAAR